MYIFLYYFKYLLSETLLYCNRKAEILGGVLLIYPLGVRRLEMRHYIMLLHETSQDGWRGHRMNISVGALGNGKINMADFTGRICV